ncbi:MAG TPA: MgtC/SapB family protein [Gaiellaceae bacterium]|jgi:putative Mg2+ transporter-C (MgtC) family protein
MLLLASASTLGDWELLLRLSVAAALGAAVGIERELRDREAGVRTHLLVSLGAALFTIVSAYGFEDFGTSVDPTRIAAQIVTGIGFLGAGAIIREGISVRGLTTAGSLWVVAGVGMAAGAGYYWAAIVGTALIFFALGPLRWIAYQTIERIRPEERRLMVEVRPRASVAPLLTELGELRSLEVEDERDRRIVTVEVERAIDEQLVSRLSDLEYVIAVRWKR